MECGTLRYCFYVPLYPTIVPAAPVIAPLLAAGARIAPTVGRFAGQVAQALPTHLAARGVTNLLMQGGNARDAMDPAMKKLKEKQQERAQKEAMERQRMAEIQNRQQMLADTSGSTTTGFDY